jgi:hypothetical protein
MDQGIVELIVMLAIMTENITYTFLNGSIFSSIRGWVKTHNRKELFLLYIDELINCQLCLSFWVTCGLVMLERLVSSDIFSGMFIVLAVHAFSRYITSIMDKLNRL